MNLKPNLWTLLFILAAGAFLYTYTNGGNAPLPNPNDGAIVEIPNKYQIKAKEYRIDRVAYRDRQCELRDMLNNNNSINKDTTLAQRILPVYYALDKEEVKYISLLSDQDDDGMIYIMPIWESIKIDDSKKHKPAVSFAFMEEPLEELTDKDKAYNFVVPCPPLCKEKNLLPFFCNLSQ